MGPLLDYPVYQCLRDPASWVRLLTGGVNFGKLMGGIAKIAQTRSPALSALESMVFAKLAEAPNAVIILASGDATALAFADAAARDHRHASGASRG